MATVPPTKDSELEPWSANLGSVIQPTPSLFNMTAAQATAYVAAAALFASKRAVSIDPATRTKASIQDKDAAKASLLDLSRSTLRILEGVPGLTPQQRTLLGMNPARNTHPGRIPTPTTRPVGLLDDRGFLRLVDETTPTVRRRPKGVAGAYLFVGITDAGQPLPVGPEDGAHFWKMSSDPTVQIPIPPGSFGKVMTVFAQWTNAKGAAGPTSAPISVVIAVGAAAVA
jgi:hypothetical protein